LGQGLQRALKIFGLLIAIGAAVWLGRDTVLRAAANLWIVSDQASSADAVAVFGGGLATRPFAAAKYYQEGLVKKVLVADAQLYGFEPNGLLPSQADLNRAILLKLGVPETSIETFGIRLTNTYEESVALRKWAVNTHAHSIIVPTEIFSSRRVRWILKREFAGSTTHIQVPALSHPRYTPADWWKNDTGLTAFRSEVLKYVYYRLKY
jgi:uncharacterized SAM-binding protein YcdF (DUF218 family)